MATADPLIRIRTEGRVRYLTLNRPAALNALSQPLLADLDAAVAAARTDDNIGCLVISGSGEKAFCAGADLTELTGLDATAARRLLSHGQRILGEIEALPIPVIAAVDGYALGGGLELALACPLLLSSTRSRFGLPEAKLAAMPGYGGTQRLRQAIGRAPALHMMLTGRPLTAEHAWQLGMLSQPPVGPERLPDLVAEVATELAGFSRATLGLILESARSSGVSDEALRHEAALGAIAISSADGQEGICAFQDKRPPNFHGRTS